MVYKKFMNWKKALGFGILVWIIMFVVVSILVAYKMSQGTSFSVITTIVTLVAAYLLARNIAPKSSGQAIQYGLVFAIVGIILDFFISNKFAPGMFNSIFYWISYLLIVLIPLLAVKKVSIQQPQPQQQ